MLKLAVGFFVSFLMTLTLSGCLPAVFTATTGSAIAAAKDQSIGETIDDIKIAAAIRTVLAKKKFKELYTKIHVEVSQGRVLYTGSVEKDEDIQVAIQTAWDQKGVKEVINELTVDQHSNHFDLVQYTKDTMITSQIKSKMFADRTIKVVNYTILTLNNVVYIFGQARSEDELEKVGEIASKIRGVEKVVSHAKVAELNNG